MLPETEPKAKMLNQNCRLMTHKTLKLQKNFACSLALRKVKFKTHKNGHTPVPLVTILRLNNNFKVVKDFNFFIIIVFKLVFKLIASSTPLIIVFCCFINCYNHKLKVLHIIPQSPCICIELGTQKIYIHIIPSDRQANRPPYSFINYCSLTYKINELKCPQKVIFYSNISLVLAA